MSRITVNLTEPGVASGGDAGTGLINAPDTGDGFVSFDGAGAIISLTAVFLMVVAAMLILLKFVRKRKTENSDSTHKTGSVASGMMSVLLVCGIVANAVSAVNYTNAVSQNLIKEPSDVEITTERAEDGTYFSVKNDIKISEATKHGYNLFVYADSTDLKFDSNPEYAIKSTTNEEPGILSDNTYGVSSTNTENADGENWLRMPSSMDEALVIKSTDEATAAGDTAEIYYGFKVNGELPVGTYVNDAVNYVALANPTLSFDGNGGDIGDFPTDGVFCEIASMGNCDTTIPAVATTPTREGYVFLGWADSATATAADPAYDTGANVTLDSDKTIYAVWEEDVDRVSVVYNGNGVNFADGAATNDVVYRENCETLYQSNTPAISKTANVDDNGEAIDGEGATASETNKVTFEGANRLKVDLEYGTELNYDYLYIFQGEYTGELSGDMDAGQIATYNGKTIKTGGKYSAGGSDSLYVEGDTVTFGFFNDDDRGSFGYFAKVYPLYDEEREDTTAVELCDNMLAESGTYAETPTWYGSWYADINNKHYDFLNEDEVTRFLADNSVALSGTTIELYRGLTFDEAYARAGKTEDEGYLVAQDLDLSACHTIAITQNKTLKDIRDGNTYFVGKLKDGNCWMMDNLRLDPSNTTTANRMSEENTNATTAAIQNYLNGGNTAGEEGWSSIAVADVDTNFSENGRTIPKINNANKDVLATGYGPASSEGKAKMGVLYNLCAASVGTYCYDVGQGANKEGTDVDVAYDVCPVNWRMPTGGADGEFGRLNQKYNTTMTATDNKSLQHNFSATLAGFYNVSSVNSKNRWGYWWSSTYYGGNAVYGLYTSSSDVYPDNNLSREFGYSVRCVVAK